MTNNISANEKESLGELLRRTREEQGIALEEIAEATKISLNNLKAIEADDYANLPAEVFVRGFCVIYAGHLSLDPEAIRERFNQQKLNMPRRSTKKVPTPSQIAFETNSMAERPAVASHSVIGLSLLAIIIIAAAVSWYLSWNPATFLSQKLRGSSTQNTVPPELNAPTSKTDPPQTMGKGEPVTTSPITVTPLPEKALSPEPAGIKPIVSVPPIIPGAIPPAGQEGMEKAPAPANVGPLPQIQPARPPETNTYILKASSKEATQITIKVDDNPAERFDLAAGQNRSWNAGKSIVITLPAGTGTTFTLNDIPFKLPNKPAGQDITVSIPEYLLE